MEAGRGTVGDSAGQRRLRIDRQLGGEHGGHPPHEAELEREVARAGLTGDPLGPVLAAFLGGAREVRAAVERVRDPLPPEERHRVARLLAREAAGELALLRPWLAVTALAAAFLAGALTVAVAWWQAPVPSAAGPLAPAVLRFLADNPALARSLETCRAVGEQDGRTVCALTYWGDPLQPPRQ